MALCKKDTYECRNVNKISFRAICDVVLFGKMGAVGGGGTVAIEKYLPASGMQRNTEDSSGLQRTTVASIFRNQK